jgi:hypothetical protein
MDSLPEDLIPGYRLTFQDNRIMSLMNQPTWPSSSFAQFADNPQPRAKKIAKIQDSLPPKILGSCLS